MKNSKIFHALSRFQARLAMFLRSRTKGLRTSCSWHGTAKEKFGFRPIDFIFLSLESSLRQPAHPRTRVGFRTIGLGFEDSLMKYVELWWDRPCAPLRNVHEVVHVRQEWNLNRNTSAISFSFSRDQHPENHSQIRSELGARQTKHVSFFRSRATNDTHSSRHRQPGSRCPTHTVSFAAG